MINYATRMPQNSVSAQDELFSAEAIARLAGKQNNPQVQCETLPDCGHLDCVFGVAERVRQFIA